jgi:hypothetical protein
MIQILKAADDEKGMRLDLNGITFLKSEFFGHALLQDAREFWRNSPPCQPSRR